MMIDAQELAERFSIATIDGGQSDREALAYLLTRYPLACETAAGYSGFLDGASNPHNALPIEAGAAAELRRLLIPFCNAERKKAKPDREALRQYIELGFTLYAQAETPDGKRAFVSWQTGKWGKKGASEIKSLDELDAALERGVSLFGFLPSERGLVCLDVDVGHASGEDGYKSIERLLEREGFEANPFNTARAAVSTPSGGCHLYFANWTQGRRFLAQPLKAVDCFGEGIGKTLTAAGSVKKGRLYELEGDLSSLTPLPLSLLPYLENTTPARAQAVDGSERRQNPSVGGGAPQGAGFRKTYSLEEKVAYYIKQAAAQRNDTAFHVGLRLGARYDLGAIVEACIKSGFFAFDEDFTLKELKGAVASGAAKSTILPKKGA